MASLTGMQKGDHRLYFGILVIGLLLAVVVEAKPRKALPSPDNRPSTDL
jgi:hypothetical protein